MIIYDLDWAGEPGEWPIFENTAKLWGINVRLEMPPLKNRGREYPTFTVAGAEKALVAFLNEEYCGGDMEQAIFLVTGE